MKGDKSFTLYYLWLITFGKLSVAPQTVLTPGSGEGEEENEGLRLWACISMYWKLGTWVVLWWGLEAW